MPCPSPHGVRPLAGILLCGARTFLHTVKPYSDCLAVFTRPVYQSARGAPGQCVLWLDVDQAAVEEVERRIHRAAVEKERRNVPAATLQVELVAHPGAV